MAEYQISKELFLAILSMDSYNRGYGAGVADGLGAKDADGNDIDGLGEAGSLVGSAQVLNIPLPEGSKSAGFYAIAYKVGEGVEGIAPGTTIIAYRGTDAILNNDISGGSDVINGWGVGPTLDNPRGAAHAGRVCHKRSCAGV